ncbi:MAG: hypothetical protein RMJ44_04855 [Cytophagales bacterium]|nr:hypothetical protein [Bernardetiaceae bacterium]MDW8210395.1 hypothetical protein [Cytophagales bacterium]
MKTHLALWLLVGIVAASCQQQVSPQAEPTEIAYDSLIFHPDITRRNTTRERTARAKITPENVRGKFYTDIAGLDLNEADGTINIDRSEAGILYTVRFVPDNPQFQPDTTKVLIAGIDYLDSIYVLARNRFRAFPILNADRNYKNNKGTAGLPASMNARFTANLGFTTNLPPLMDSLGVIDMSRAKDIILQRRRTVSNFTNPLSLTIRYTIRDTLQIVKKDTSRNTPRDTLGNPVKPFYTVQHTIGVQIYHYQFRTDIPEFVLNALRERRTFPRGRTENTPRTERPVILIVVDRD